MGNAIVMRPFQRRRSLRRRSGVRVHRRVIRSVFRPAHRVAIRRAVRPVLPSTGPTLREVVAAFNAYIKWAEKHPIPHPIHSYNQLLADQKARQQWEADLQRAYGSEAQAARAAAAASKPPPPAAPVSPPPSPAKPLPPADDKQDITQVPLRPIPGGGYWLDWDAVKRPKQ